MIVVYNNFNILKKLSHCSLVEYYTIYGVKKSAIILNNANKIIYDLDINQNFHNFYEQILIEQNKRFSSLVTVGFTIKLIGDYELHNNEFIVNIPYNLKLKFVYQNSRNLQYKSSSSKLSKNINKAINLILNQTSKNDRLDLLIHKIVGIDTSAILLYEFDEDKILRLSEKKLNEKRKYNRETYEILLEKYYKEKASMSGKKNLKMQELSKKIIPKKSIKEAGTKFIEKLDIDLKKEIESRSENTYDHLQKNDINSSNSPIIKSVKMEVEIINERRSDIFDIKSIQKDLVIPNGGNLEPEKKLRTFTATNRNLTIVKYLKDLYQNKCQICGETIEVSPNNFLSEVHHIKPLGEHVGADVIENMIVLCPNHHAMFDRGSITIDLDKKVVIHFNHDNPLNNKQIQLKHVINRNYLDYHSKNIFFSSDQSFKHQIASCQIQIINDNEIDENFYSVDYESLITLQDIRSEDIFDIKLEDKYNKEFMRPLEKKSLGKCLNSIVEHNGFYYRIIKIKHL